MRFSMLVIPPDDVRAMASADGLSRLPELRMHAWPNDAVLCRCLSVLAKPCCGDDTDALGDRDDASRLLVLRVAELMGVKKPDWRSDGCSFSNRTINDLVFYIDAHLRVAPTASEMSTLCGLCPSHFAKKFRRSTGMSLHAFIMRRRIMMSLTMLRQLEDSLAGIATSLGFSSQSHFTRIFSDMTGMTPAKYRKLFKRTVG